MRYCINCGSMNDTDAKFCQGCGKKFDSAPQDGNAEESADLSRDYTTENINDENYSDCQGQDNQYNQGIQYNDQYGQESQYNQGAQYNAQYGQYNQYNDPNSQYNQYGYNNQYNQNPYGNNPYGQQGGYIPQGTAKNRGIAGMVLGIASIVLAWPVWILALPSAIVGLVLSGKSLKEGPYNIAKAGRVLSIIGIVFCAIWLAIIIIYVVAYSQHIYNFSDFSSYY